MKKIKNVLIFFLTIINIINSAKNIWLIRHCDKTNDNQNPCCSNYGYERSTNWYKYFEIYINSSPYIYASNYSEKKQCVTNNYNEINPECQKSQRMYLTAEAIYNSIYNIKDKINSNYCIGQYKDMIKSSYNVKNNDIIIVWEHSEIVDIINFFGINIKNWPKNIEDEYSIVFMIDNNINKLYYECFQWETQSFNCTKNVNDWLNKCKTISEYYRDKR